jgi:hypothetical protein
MSSAKRCGAEQRTARTPRSGRPGGGHRNADVFFYKKSGEVQADADGWTQTDGRRPADQTHFFLI